MQRYKNLSGNSGVEAFELGPGSIRVKFKDGMVYLYTVRSAGRLHIESMQQLALDGEGLNAYINRHVRNGYAGKGHGNARLSH